MTTSPSQERVHSAGSHKDLKWWSRCQNQARARRSSRFVPLMHRRRDRSGAHLSQPHLNRRIWVCGNTWENYRFRSDQGRGHYVLGFTRKRGDSSSRSGKRSNRDGDLCSESEKWVWKLFRSDAGRKRRVGRRRRSKMRHRDVGCGDWGTVLADATQPQRGLSICFKANLMRLIQKKKRWWELQWLRRYIRCILIQGHLSKVDCADRTSQRLAANREVCQTKCRLHKKWTCGSKP